MTTNGPVQTRSLEDLCPSPNSPHLFELVHYIVLASIDKRAIGLRLEGILVLHFFVKFLGTLPHPMPPVKLFNSGYGKTFIVSDDMLGNGMG